MTFCLEYGGKVLNNKYMKIALQDPADMPRDAKLISIILQSQNIDYDPRCIPQLYEFMGRYVSKVVSESADCGWMARPKKGVSREVLQEMAVNYFDHGRLKRTGYHFHWLARSLGCACPRSDIY